MAMIRCSECGAEISDMSASCPKCGCPTQESINVNKQQKRQIAKKKVITIGTVIAVVIILILIVNGIGNKSDDMGYYNGVEWGMSLDQVTDKLDAETIEYTEEDSIACSIKNYDGIDGVNALVSYDFGEDNGLHEIYVFLDNSDLSSYSTETLMNQYVDKLDELYGEHEEDGIMLVWTSEKSKIEMIKFTGSSVSIAYKDINSIESDSEE